MQKIVIIDYGSSNLRSVAKALEMVAGNKQTITISNEPKTILNADKIVFPGQGSIGQCMYNLKKQELDKIVYECILNKPFLGICLGLHSLMTYSEEDGGIEGLGILDGKVLRFKSGIRDKNDFLYKIPAMGWNRVYQTRTHPLWKGIKEGDYFYFVHSYYVKLEDKSAVIANTEYICKYTSAVARNNLFAVQFHPEKSQQAGLQLLKNFSEWKI